MIGVPFLLSTINLMAVKVLVNQIGQHIIAETKQVENKETKKNRDDIERLFADVAPKLSNVIPAVNTSNIQKQITDEINLTKLMCKYFGGLR